MKLVSFSVENYRSITTARKVQLSGYSLLIGANNEGKSNLLHALTLAMDALVDWHRSLRRTIDGRILGVSARYSGYDWSTDFPIQKQRKANDKSITNITLEFLLDETEIVLFKSEIGSTMNGTLPISISFGKDGFNLFVQKPGKGFASLNKKSTRIAGNCSGPRACRA
jgi:AAA15 family ATPase/GTPase